MGMQFVPGKHEGVFSNLSSRAAEKRDQLSSFAYVTENALCAMAKA
jgi:hypothetical protein